MRAAALLVLWLSATSAWSDLPTVAVSDRGDARIVAAAVPGRVLDLVTVPAAGGRRQVAVLAAAEPGDDGPRSVFVLDPGPDPSWIEAASGLSCDVNALGVLAVRAGGPDLVLGGPGSIFTLGPAAQLDGPRTPRLLLAAPGIDLRRQGTVADAAFLPSPSVGLLELFRVQADGAPELAGTFDLPIRARRKPTGLRLETPPMTVLPRAGGAPLFLFGPEARGRRRLLTTWVDPSGEALEAWSQLPAPEEVRGRRYVVIDGRPTLVVTTVSSEKLGIFTKLRLRVFPLSTDRPRAGTPSTLSRMTTTVNWYPVAVEALDWNRDGRDDLALLQPDGLGAKKLAVEVYLGKGNGGFLSASLKSVVVAPGARFRFGADPTGDGVPDLVAFSGDRLLVFAGVAAGKKKLVVEKKPRWSFEVASFDDNDVRGDNEVTVTVGEAEEEDDEDYWDDESDWDDSGRFEELQVVDLDGDGRAEILLVSQRDQLTAVRIFELR